MKRLTTIEMENMMDESIRLQSGSYSSWYMNQVQIELLLRILDKLNDKS